jgi:hypothetical protein
LATTNKSATRSAIADVWKRITRLQTKYDLPAYSVAVFETRGGLHAHITFIGTREIAKRLQRSSVFAIDVRPVTDANGLVRNYLSKERTPQAGYGREYILVDASKGHTGSRAEVTACVCRALWNAMPSKPAMSTHCNTAMPGGFSREGPIDREGHSVLLDT